MHRQPDGRRAGRILVTILLAALAIQLPATALAALALNPENCASYTVIPQMFKFWQTQTRWTGVAVGPLEPSYSTYLRAWSDEFGNGIVLGSSTYAGQTNFMVRNWPSAEYGYVEVYNDPPENATFLIDWEPGLGALPLAQDVSVSYGGLGWDCGLFRVWDVTLAAGQNYAFSLETDQPDDDLRMALLHAADDAWLSRGQALWEMALAPGGVETTHDFLAVDSGTYALVVFNNTVDTFGGTYTLRAEAVSPDPEPDLVVSSITFQDNWENERATVTATITNMGGATAGAGTAELTVDGTTVWTWSVGSIPPGNSSIMGRLLDPLPAGTYDVEVCADAGDDVDEADEDNNCTSQELVMRLKPDLVIERIDPDAANEGQDIMLWATVRNQGAGDADPSVSSIAFDGTTLCGSIATPAIAAGQGVAVPCHLGSVGPGTYDVSASANVTQAFPETDPYNNSATEPIIVHTTSMADLVIDRIEPDAAAANTPITVTVYVRNQGGLDAPGSSARLWVDGDIAASWLDTPPVPAGQTVATESCVIGSSWGGTLEVKAHADFGGIVPESEDLNNDKTETIVVAPPALVWIHPDGSGDFPTIQEAVDILPAGVSIFLTDGVFTGEGNRDVNFHGKDFEVRSQTGHEGLPIIDCQGGPEWPDLHRAFTFNSGETRSSRLYGLTITGGWDNGGGAICIGNAEPTVERCVLYGNHANDAGGALSIAPSVSAYPLISRCTIVGNYAQEHGAIRLGGSAWPEVTHCIIAFNGGYYGPVGEDPYSGAAIELTCSDVFGNSSGDFVHFLAGLLGVNDNFSADPAFCDPDNDVYTLAHDSPCHTLQNPCGWVGALEEGCGSSSQHVYLVKADGTGDFPTIQLAIHAADDGDVIELADGVFQGSGNRSISTLGKAITIRSASGNSANCVIDPQGTAVEFHGGFQFYNGEGPATVLESVTIRNAYLDAGAALYFGGSAPTINNVVVENCTATLRGGAVWTAYGAQPVLTNCRFAGNASDGPGGVVYIDASCSATFDACDFETNTAGTRGGVAYVDGGVATFADCTFRDNSSPENGGALSYWNGATGAVTDCLFVGNSSHGGGGFIFEDCAPAVTGCTFLSNSAAWGGAGYCNAGANPAITACTFHQNSATNGGMAMSVVSSAPLLTRVLMTGQLGNGDLIACVSGSVVDLDCCDLYGNANGDYTSCLAGQLGVDGNISADPMYCPDNGPEEFALHADSPCAEPASACGLIGAWPVACGPQTVAVRADGSGDHPTIQAAIDATGAGSTILLGDGVYTGGGNRDVDFRGRPYTVRSESGDPAACVIDCQANETTPYRGFLIDGATGGASLLADLTVRNAWKNYGGGALVRGSQADVENCRFENCISTDGGGIFYTDAASGTVSDCRFTGNSASNAGGGVRVNPDCAVTIQDCDFVDNYGHWGGGAIYAYHGTPSVIGCLFVGNDSYAWGGAVHLDYGAGHEIYSSTFHGNAAPSGGALYLRHGASATVDHCILACSTVGAATYCSADSEVELICCDVWNNAGGDWTGCIAGMEGLGGNFSADPLFCDAAAGDFGLQAESPCATGGCGVIGARPASCGFILAVEADGSGAYPTIQAAIDAATNGDVVLLADGTYTGTGNRDLDTQGKRLRIRSAGGDPGLCVIDCGGSASDPHRAFHFQGGETSETVVENLTIRNGHAEDGGGILCTGASPSLVDVRFENCAATADGGGMGCLDHSSPLLTDAWFEGCTAGTKGGGLYATDFSSPIVTGTVFTGNQAATRGGGALFTVNSFPTLESCAFVENEASLGGGLAVVYSYGPVIGCSFFGNTAGEGGGLYLRGNVQATFTSCTVAGNTTTGGGGAVSVLVNSDPVFESCLIAFDALGPAVVVDGTSTATFGCSDIYGNHGGDWQGAIAGQVGLAGNIAEDPVFCGLPGGNLTLDAASPCLPGGNSCGVQMGAHGEGCTGTAVDENAPPAASFLAQNRPNPFNPVTRIRLDLAGPRRVDLRVFDLAGRCVRTLMAGRELEAGSHEFTWDGRSDDGTRLASGVYFCRVEAGDYGATRKMVLIK